MHNHKNNSGFTLIEIMVTVAIVGIFASIALPNFSRLIENNRINTATNELVANLLLARSEALKRRNRVTLCPSTDQINCDSNDYSDGWIVFLDCATIGTRVTVAVDPCGTNNREDIIKVGDGFDNINMAQNSNRITFNFTGRPSGLATFNIGASGSAATKRVTVNLVGRVKARTLP